MFERDLSEITSGIWFDDKDTRIADEEGIGFFVRGDNYIASSDVVDLCGKYDRALLGTMPRAKKNRLRMQRNSIVTAFGPEMVALVGFAK